MPRAGRWRVAGRRVTGVCQDQGRRRPATGPTARASLAAALAWRRLPLRAKRPCALNTPFVAPPLYAHGRAAARSAAQRLAGTRANSVLWLIPPAVMRALRPPRRMMGAFPSGLAAWFIRVCS